jgi:hypothetical protein
MTGTTKTLMSRSALIGAAPVVIALMLSGIISFSYNRLLKEYRDDVDHTFQVMSAIDSALLNLQDAETGQRGFIITGDESYLAVRGGPRQAVRSSFTARPTGVRQCRAASAYPDDEAAGRGQARRT